MSIHCIKSILDPPPSPVLLYISHQLSPQEAPTLAFQNQDFQLEASQIQANIQPVQESYMNEEGQTEDSQDFQMVSEQTNQNQRGKRSYKEFMGLQNKSSSIKLALSILKPKPRKRTNLTKLQYN